MIRQRTSYGLSLDQTNRLGRTLNSHYKCRGHHGGIRRKNKRGKVSGRGEADREAPKRSVKR